MKRTLKYIFIITQLIFSTGSILKSQNKLSTNFSTLDCIVLQICPEEIAGETIVNEKKYKRTAAFVFLPNTEPGNTLSCPLNYFQESCSISEKWIKDDSCKKIKLTNIDRLSKVVITKKSHDIEEVINLSEYISRKLFDYFKYDVENNLAIFKGFDCYALQSLLGNVKYYPLNPAWDYKETIPELGDFVVLTNSIKLPDSIKHWALYLGDDIYLSKFGRSGEGTQSQVTIMNLEGMKLLYDCKYIYTAYPQMDAEPWKGYNSIYE